MTDEEGEGWRGLLSEEVGVTRRGRRASAEFENPSCLSSSLPLFLPFPPTEYANLVSQDLGDTDA